MTECRTKEQLPVFEPTDNGWLGEKFSTTQISIGYFNEGAFCVDISENNAHGFWKDKIKIFHNDGEYVHFHEILLKHD